MSPGSVILKTAAVGLTLLVVLQLGASTHLPNVCYSRRTYYVYTRQVYYYNDYYTTWCWGSWGRWFRCGRYRRVAVYYRSSSPRYYSSSQCCSGFSGSGCQPQCTSTRACRNGGTCTDPNVCTCPSTWTGNTCQTDVNECALNRDNCQHNCINTAGGFRCSCYSGYQLSANGYSCNDMNECVIGTHQCDQTCSNTVGGYTCSCSSGWTLSSNGRSCDDVPECTLGTDNCQQECVEQPGSFSCACRAGYRLQPDGRSCADIDECAESSDQCDQNCHNNVGSYTCSCNTGYRLAPDGRSCVNIDECAENTDGCEHNCHDTIGSYYCSCRTGYRLDSNQRSCNDIDECAENTDGCAQLCTNSIGSYVCSCNTGYRLDADRHTCNDINECAEGTDQCAQNCHNNIGSYTCSCNTGYRLASDGYGCDDIDECAEGSHQCAQNCHNNIGSYTCSCNIGYRLNVDGRGCDDIDECAEGTDQCEHNCHNNIGSYTCSCRIGYRLNDNGFGCDDIDECQEPEGSPDLHQCDQVCHNNIGSYTCSCGPGYVLDPDGRTCNDIDECLLDIDGCDHNCNNTIGSYICSCYIGWRLNDDRHTCSDIDECAEPDTSPDADMCDQNCHNNIGSYTCSCNIGWTLDFDGLRCNDVDECLPDGIGRHGDLACQQDCVNTPGSYNCACRTGYNITADGITCTDIDECNEPDDSPDKDQCDANSNCINNEGSYSCSCFNGYVLLPDGRSCQDVDECAEGMPCGQGAECANTPGSFLCTCPSGTIQNAERTRCNDINECDDGTHLCEHDCMNTVGSYTCFCSDRHTNADDGINCLASPQNYVVTRGGSRTIVVTWSTPDATDGNVLQYTLIVQSPDDPSFFRQVVITDPSAVSFIVEGVTPATGYECCLTVRTNLGDSPFSCANDTTLEDTPDTPPSDISTDLDDPYRIIVRWDTPTHPSGVITGYTIYVDYGNGNIVPIQLESTDRSYEITGLRPYQTVLVAMSANTTVGEGVVSGYLSYTTQQTAPPSPEATFSVLNDQSFRVTWTAPSPSNGVLTQYFVLITNVRTGYRQTFTKQSTDFDLSVTLDDLTPFVPYTVEIRAATEAGIGEPKTLIIYTKQGVPVKPLITAAPRTSGEDAQITLQPISPDDAHGYLTRVEIAYSEAGSRNDDCSDFDPNKVDENSVLVIEDDLDDSVYSLSALDAGQEYCVAVRASTALGSSEYSDPFKVTLSSPIPVQVRFTLTSDQQCGSYVTENPEEKIRDINQAIADYVVDSCQCNSFSPEYLTDAMLDCVKPTSNEFIYKANVLATNELGSTDIRDTHIQGFVDTAPVVPVLGDSFRVNSYCNTTLDNLEPGNSLCFAPAPTDAPGSAAGSNTIILALEIVGGVAGAALLSLVIFVPVCIACCCCARKDVKNKREGMNVHDQMDGRDINTRSSGVSERPLLTNAAVGVGTLSRGTLTRKPPGNTGTLSRGTLTRKQPGNKYQSGYEAMDTLQRTRELQSTLPRGHRPVSDFDPDYEAVEDDGAIRKIDLGSKGTTPSFSNPSYADEDDFDY